MEAKSNGSRFKNYYLWETRKNMPYDYERNGLLKYIMSPVILKTKNTALKILLEYIESSMIFIMKYTDILKNFKNIHWKNR